MILDNKDLNLKLRLKRILFQMGYYSPIEVELSQYDDTGLELKRTSLTDLDVLGIKFDPALISHKVVGDCKTGKGVSDLNRLFWLRGVLDYFGANTAYYLRSRVGRQARTIAPKLGIRTVDEKDLQILEKNLGVESIPIPMHDPNFHSQQRQLWGISVPKDAKPTPDQLELKNTYTYLAYNYWYIDQNRNLFLLVAHFQKIAHLLNSFDPRDVFLAHTGVQRFAHCVLEMASNIQARGTDNIPQNAKAYLYGGSLALRDRQEFFKLLNRLTGSNEPLDPPFLNDITEFTNRIINNPVAASEVLRYLEAIYCWCVQLGNNDIAPVFGGKPSLGAIVLARDAAITFYKATGMREDIFSKILAL
ncbi:hypothetical protein ES703_21799 [subsurface metagenome]